MTKVILGRYALPYYIDGPTFYGSDAFWEPNNNVFGVATSTHHYDLYPISERDVQIAFDLVRTTLSTSDLKLTGTELLRSLLRNVHRGFGEIDIHTHIADIEFNRSPEFGDPAEDSQSTPRVRIILLQLQGRQLSIACVGNFQVYAIRPTEQELIFGREWDTGAYAVINPDPLLEPFIIAYQNEMPEIYQWETEVRSGDLIIAKTPIGVPKIWAGLGQLLNTTGCNPEVVNRHLLTTLASVLEKVPESSKSYFRRWGAAWTITCVEK